MHLLRALRTADPFAGDDEYTPPPWRRPFIFHIGDHQRADAYRINALAFGWDAAPFIAQSISQDMFNEVTLGAADFDALVYMDDGLTIAHDTTTSAKGHSDCVAAIRRNGLIEHATKTRGDPSHDADWLGKCISAIPPVIRPSAKSATSAIAATVLAVSSSLSMKDRQVLTGSLTWLGIQHRCHLPFLGPAHRFRPPRRGRGVLPARSALSVVAAAALGTLPWVGQGPLAIPGHRPTMTVFFDGVCIPSRGAFAAAFVPPGLAVLTTVAHADQQHAELVALLLALHLAASNGSTQCVLIDQSLSVSCHM
eukprot:gene57290-biopygen111357